jgi:hypothetical protein
MVAIRIFTFLPSFLNSIFAEHQVISILQQPHSRIR